MGVGDVSLDHSESGKPNTASHFLFILIIGILSGVPGHCRLSNACIFSFSSQYQITGLVQY